MKSLKKVPGKNKGLSKLPTAVRNKMGYMKKGGKVMKSGGKVVKYQTGGENVMLDQVVVKGKKGAGVREQGVVARGKTGAEYLEHRDKLTKELTSAYITKKRRHPSYKLNADERDMINDQVRSQMYKDGYQETGVIRKDTKERLSPEMEKAAQDRLRRK